MDLSLFETEKIIINQPAVLHIKKPLGEALSSIQNFLLFIIEKKRRHKIEIFITNLRISFKLPDGMLHIPLRDIIWITSKYILFKKIEIKTPLNSFVFSTKSIKKIIPILLELQRNAVTSNQPSGFNETIKKQNQSIGIHYKGKSYAMVFYPAAILLGIIMVGSPDHGISWSEIQVFGIGPKKLILTAIEILIALPFLLWGRIFGTLILIIGIFGLVRMYIKRRYCM
jgi:hypothetical protein